MTIISDRHRKPRWTSDPNLNPDTVSELPKKNPIIKYGLWGVQIFKEGLTSSRATLGLCAHSCWLTVAVGSSYPQSHQRRWCPRPGRIWQHPPLRQSVEWYLHNRQSSPGQTWEALAQVLPVRDVLTFSLGPLSLAWDTLAVKQGLKREDCAGDQTKATQHFASKKSLPDSRFNENRKKRAYFTQLDGYQHILCPCSSAWQLTRPISVVGPIHDHFAVLSFYADTGETLHNQHSIVSYIIVSALPWPLPSRRLWGTSKASISSQCQSGPGFHQLHNRSQKERTPLSMCCQNPPARPPNTSIGEH